MYIYILTIFAIESIQFNVQLFSFFYEIQARVHILTNKRICKYSDVKILLFRCEMFIGRGLSSTIGLYTSAVLESLHDQQSLSS